MAQTTYTLPWTFLARPGRTLVVLNRLAEHIPAWGLTLVSVAIPTTGGNSGRFQFTLSDAMTQAQIDHIRILLPDD